MESDGGDQKADPDPKNEAHKGASALQRRVAEAIVLILYFLWDGLDKWPVSHSEALLLAVIGTSAVLLIELPLKVWGAASAVLIAMAFAIYIAVPLPAPVLPSQAPLNEITGELIPSNELTPHTPCDPYAKENSLTVLMAGAGFVSAGEHITPLQIGRCQVLTLARNGQGSFINADIYDSFGSYLGTIKNNKYSIIANKGISVSTPDLATLEVRDGDNAELLYVRYLNPLTIIVRGSFGCENHATVKVDDWRSLGLTKIWGSCFQEDHLMRPAVTLQ